MSGLIAGAQSGVFDLGTPVEVEFLNRAGIVWRALCRFWGDSPDDDHPSLSQIRSHCSKVGKDLCERTITRALSDLAKLRKVVVEPDPDHPVGRKITPIDPPTVLSGGDRTVHDRTVDSYVVRKSASAPHVSRGDDRTVTPPASDADPLSRVLGRLEHDPDSVEPAVRRLCREYGEKFEPFYRQTCMQVRSGQLAIGDVIGAAEYCDGPKIRHRGKAFIDQVKRRIKGLFKAKPSPLPTPEEPKKPDEPTPCPKPEPEQSRELGAKVADNSRLEARWASLPASRREQIRARVRAENPGLGRWTNMLEPLCIAAMEAEPQVFVLPTDDQLGSLKELAFAEDPLMRSIARSELSRLNRDDVFRAGWDQTRPAGQAPEGPPAGPN